jgi:hypothetical protein
MKVSAEELEETIRSYLVVRGLTEKEFFAYLARALEQAEENTPIREVIAIMDKKVKEDKGIK